MFLNCDSGDCADTVPEGATDTWGYGCNDYIEHESECNRYNDDDFVTEEMCCVCGGGEDVPGNSCK